MLLLHAWMRFLFNLNCNEFGIHFKISVAITTKTFNLVVTAVIIRSCPSMSIIGHSFPRMVLPQMLLIILYSIHLDWSMASGAMWKPCTLDPLWGNTIHQKPSQAQKTFWVLPSMLENWQLIEEQSSILMSLLGLESINARLTNVKTWHLPLETIYPSTLHAVKNCQLVVCNNENWLS